MILENTSLPNVKVGWATEDCCPNCGKAFHMPESHVAVHLSIRKFECANCRTIWDRPSCVWVMK